MRDLLFGSLFRDPRGHQFQRMVREPPDWLLQAARALTREARDVAMRVWSLAYLSYDSYAQVLTDSDDESLKRTVHRAIDCPPMGMMVRTDGETDLRECRWRFCPWCHARRTLGLYHGLQSSTPDDGDSLLIRGRIIVPSTRLNPSVIARHVDCEEFPERAEVKFVKSELMPQLQGYAESRGSVSGLSTYQLGPHRTRDGETLFSHELGYLGLVPQCDDFLRRFPSRSSRGGDWLYLGGDESLVTWLAMPQPDLHLRTMLAGSASKIPDTWVVYGNTHDTAERRLPDGIAGALSWAPTYLWTPEQFSAASIAVHGVKSTQRHGGWNEPASQSPSPLAPANQQRNQNAQDRREQLLMVAREVWEDVLRAIVGQPGRPAYRKLLAEHLRRHGTCVSDRDVAWLVKQLRQGSSDFTNRPPNGV